MNLASYVATLGPIGYVKGSGTLASLISLPLVWYARTFYCEIQTLILIGILCAAFVSITVSLPLFERFHDPSEIVIDEVAGIFVTFYGLHNFSLLTLVVGFCSFRFFDIAKPLGIKKCEHLKGAWGVLLDDCAAGILSAIVIRLIGSLCII